MEFLRIFFSYICGQQHTLVLGGITLPFCQRCIGLYVGAFVAIALVSWLRPRPGAFFYWLHGVFMLVMFPFGFHLVDHGALVRTFTGTLFAFGMVYFLMLNLLTRFHGWKPESRLRLALYLILLSVATLSLLVMIRYGQDGVAISLAVIGLLGFAGIATLTAANLMLLPQILRTLLNRSAAPAR